MGHFDEVQFSSQVVARFGLPLDPARQYQTYDLCETPDCSIDGSKQYLVRPDGILVRIEWTRAEIHDGATLDYVERHVVPYTGSARLCDSCVHQQVHHLDNYLVEFLNGKLAVVHELNGPEAPLTQIPIDEDGNPVPRTTPTEKRSYMLWMLDEFWTFGSMSQSTAAPSSESEHAEHLHIEATRHRPLPGQ